MAGVSERREGSQDQRWLESFQKDEHFNMSPTLLPEVFLLRAFKMNLRIRPFFTVQGCFDFPSESFTDCLNNVLKELLPGTSLCKYFRSL